MAQIDVNGTQIHYTDTGGVGPVIVFSHGLLFSTEMFEDQVAHFRDRYRCIAYDHRGQGQSAPAESGYDMDTLAGDAAGLIRALGVEGCHFVGLSMGGFVALRMALDHRELVQSISVLDSSADPEPEENHGKYKFLNFVLRWIGSKPVAGAVMPIMFGKSFLNDPTQAEKRAHWKRFVGNVPNRKSMAKAVAGVIEREGVYARLGEIEVPTLILVGEEDTATVPAKSERMHAAIAGSVFKRVAKGGHVSTIDAPEAVNAALDEFLTSLSHR